MVTLNAAGWAGLLCTVDGAAGCSAHPSCLRGGHWPEAASEFVDSQSYSQRLQNRHGPHSSQTRERRTYASTYYGLVVLNTFNVHFMSSC